MKTRMSLQNMFALKLLILICAQRKGIREKIYGNKKLLLVKLK